MGGRRAAVAYYRAYPEEIDERLAREAYWTPERVAHALEQWVEKRRAEGSWPMQRYEVDFVST